MAIAAGDLNGDGQQDLVVRNLGDNTLSIFFANGSGGFAAPVRVPVEADFGGLSLLDLANDGKLDIVLTDFTSGDAQVLHNDGAGTFTDEGHFHSGTGLYVLGVLANDAIQSNEGFAEAVAGDLNGDHKLDLVTLNSNLDSFSVLYGKGTGNFVNPQTYALNAQPNVAVLGDFTSNGRLDLAVGLANSTMAIYTNGPGGFTATASFTLPISFSPEGLTTVLDPGSGYLDLIVTSATGNVLTLLGNGDGTFRALVQTGDSVPFVTADLTGNGQQDCITANQAASQITAQLRVAGTTTFTAGAFAQNQGNGLLGPGNVLLTDLNGDGIPDLVVANTGSDNVLVYLGLGGGRYGSPQSFGVGTNPVGLAVGDLNGDGIPDLVVANQGSNTVSVLFGQGRGTSWTMTLGQTLKVGAGPIAVQITDMNGDGIPDLVVTNGQAGSLSVLSGVGSGGKPSGFFTDNQAPSLNFPGNPTIVQTTNGFALTADGTIFRYDPSNFAATLATVFSSDPGRLVTFIDPVDLNGVTDLFAARSDGSVSELTAGSGGQLSESLVFTDPRLTDPSNLQVVEEAGTFEIYVTQTGQNVPLILEESAGRVPGGEPGEGPEGSPTTLPLLFGLPGASALVELANEDRAETTSLQPIQNSTFVLVATLLTGSADNTTGESETVAEGASLPNIALGLTALIETAEGGVGGGDEGGDEPARRRRCLRRLP